MPKPTTFVLLAILSLLQACSMASVAYKSAPWFLRDRIDDYFDLTMAQTRQIDRDIDELFAWHKYEELPNYADFLDRAGKQFMDGLTPEELESLLAEAREARERLAIRSIPIASTFLLSVSDEQLDYYQRAVREKMDERREELEVSPEERDDDDFDNLRDSLEDWFGDFDDAQLARLRVISDALPDNREYWLQQREKRAEELVTLLRSDPSREALDKYLHDWFVDWRYADDAQREISEKAYKHWQSAMLDIDQVLTVKQRKHAVAKLNDYRWDFITISTRTASD